MVESLESRLSAKEHDYEETKNALDAERTRLAMLSADFEKELASLQGKLSIANESVIKKKYIVAFFDLFFHS